MNDDTNNEISNLRVELTDVTAPAESSPQLSDEAGPLREAWLAFGQLIDASGPSLAEQALVRHIQLDAAHRSWRRRMIVAAMAASVLLMASVVWQRMRPGEQSASPSGVNQVAEQSVPKRNAKPRQAGGGAKANQGQIVGRNKRGSPVAPAPVKVAPSAFGRDRLAWDDQLDRRVDRMQRQVRSIKRPRDAEPDPIAVLRSKIDLLGRDARSDRL